jgi:signal transduction histidine kinase
MNHVSNGAVLPTACPHPLRRLLYDPLLLSALVVCVVLITYQIEVTLLQPTWVGSVTDWLRTALAWPQFLIVVWVSLRLRHNHHSATRSWWTWSVALLFYAVAQTLWALSDQLSIHQMVPIHALPDVFFILQYPFFFLAVILLPRTRFWGSRLILTLDGLLVMGAVAACSWHFILEPIYTASGMSPFTRVVSLAYPLGDLFVLSGLTITLLHPRRFEADRLVLLVLVVAVSCLVVADSLAAWLDLRPSYIYEAGSSPDAFWFAFYVLVPFAGLCQVRLVRQESARSGSRAAGAPQRWSSQCEDFNASLRFFLPIVLALLASGAIIIDATMDVMRYGWRHGAVQFLVGFCLLFLILVRQELAFLEMAQLRRETEYARASERAANELSRRKDAFLGIISHELKTPLTSLQGYLELLALRFSPLRSTENLGSDSAVDVVTARATIGYAEESLHRITQLVDELLDDAQICSGYLPLHVEKCDLSCIVQKAVNEQQALAPGRTIRLELPIELPMLPQVPVVADARRIGQVVTNYLTNAVKYSKEGQPVEVRLEVTGNVARVSVRDKGIGVPLGEQAHIWERLHPIAGNMVQSGSGVSLGVGLHICKSIVDNHGGQVGVDSTPGPGSTFWFTLPLASPLPVRKPRPVGLGEAPSSRCVLDRPGA